VGSSDWFISGDFAKNAKYDYWLIGTNVVEYQTITSSMYVEQAKEFVSEKILGQNSRVGRVAFSYPHAGQTFTKIHPSQLGQPVFNGMEGAAWLAFCSANYLKQADRQIPMPIGPSSLAFGYLDKTEVFPDDLGLPKSVKLSATNGTLVCEYEVLQKTNFLGRTFPLRFHVAQWGSPASGSTRLGSKSDLFGVVKSIRPGKPPELPDECRKAFKQ
jgi:hypothetical protein